MDTVPLFQGWVGENPPLTVARYAATDRVLALAQSTFRLLLHPGERVSDMPEAGAKGDGRLLAWLTLAERCRCTGDEASEVYSSPMDA